MLRTAVLVAAMFVLPALSHAMSGMQMARDGHRVMINKDIGNERWSMMYATGDHTVMGNVYFPSGGPPAFVWCMETGDDGNPDRRHAAMTFACYGADPCAVEPCSSDEWTFIDDVTLPGGFFMPPQTPPPAPMPGTSRPGQH
jgi:hypothetical protein